MLSSGEAERDVPLLPPPPSSSSPAACVEELLLAGAAEPGCADAAEKRLLALALPCAA